MVFGQHVDFGVWKGQVAVHTGSRILASLLVPNKNDSWESLVDDDNNLLFLVAD